MGGPKKLEFNSPFFSKLGRSPLFIAAQHGKKETVEKLLAMGAKVDEKDNEQKTPLMIAREKGHADIVEVLEKRKGT